jgi:hypothetical protein
LPAVLEEQAFAGFNHNAAALVAFEVNVFVYF